MILRGLGRGRASAQATAASSSAGASLELRNLVKRYGDSAAVDGVSLAITPGEFVTLLGPSGSGKTTTLNMIAGFVEPTAGDILMDERPIDDLPPHRRNIGMVFQSYALFPHMTAFENIAFPLKQRRVPKPELRRRVEEALDLVRLGGLGGRYPRELSGGQQQRVALARATVFRPRVLLMDEPLGALDKKLRERLQLEIKRIQNELRITFIYVTHDQDEALVLSDQIAVFRDGKIEQAGTASELYERSKSLFVADFLGESNIFPGRIEGSAGDFAVEGEGFRLRGRGSADLPTPFKGALVVRPERVRIANGSAPSPGENRLTGVIRQAIYLGSARKLEIELPGSQIVLVREQAGNLAPVGVGETVDIAWWIEDGIVLPDPEKAP